MTANPNSIPRLLGRLVVNVTIAFSLLILALLINPWSHTAAQVLAHVWLVAFVVTAFFMKRPPSHYDGYLAWWADRRNWFK